METRIEIGSAQGESHHFGQDVEITLIHPDGNIEDECFVHNSGMVGIGQRLEYWARKYRIDLNTIRWILIPEKIEVCPFTTTPRTECE